MAAKKNMKRSGKRSGPGKSSVILKIGMAVVLILLSFLLGKSFLQVTSPETKETVPEVYAVQLSVRCDSLLNITDYPQPEWMPEDGIIFSETAVSFTEGESVFDVLQREMKEAGVPMEFSQNPVLGSTFVEGIANLYYGDYGDLSGWIYQVNEVSPEVGCSEYKLQDGDKVSWFYSSDIGKDL